MSDQPALTDNQILRQEVRGQVDRMATELECVATRIRWHAAPLTTSNTPAATIIANIVKEFTQIGGGVGARLWGMIHELSRMT